MDITYLGAGSVRLSGRQVAIVCDPYDESNGLGKFKAVADVTLTSSPEVKVQAANSILIDGPGEYEVKGALVTGIPAQMHTDEPSKGEQASIYSIVVDGFSVAFLGNIAPELSNSQVEALGQIDVLILPVGGHGLTLDATAAAGIVSRLEPKFVVPTHYADDQTKYPMPQDDVSKFLKEMGVNPEPVGKLKLNSKELPLETTVVVLQRAGTTV